MSIEKQKRRRIELGVVGPTWNWLLYLVFGRLPQVGPAFGCLSAPRGRNCGFHSVFTQTTSGRGWNRADLPACGLRGGHARPSRRSRPERRRGGHRILPHGSGSSTPPAGSHDGRSRRPHQRLRRDCRSTRGARTPCTTFGRGGQDFRKTSARPAHQLLNRSTPPRCSRPRCSAATLKQALSLGSPSDVRHHRPSARAAQPDLPISGVRGVALAAKRMIDRGVVVWCSAGSQQVLDRECCPAKP